MANNQLENLAQLFLANKSPQDAGVETANIAGHNLLVHRTGGNSGAVINQGMQGLAQGYINGQTLQKKNQFLQGVQGITQSQKNPDEKVNDLMSLMAEHGTDYGLGLKDIIDQYGKMAQRGQNKLFKIDENGNPTVPNGFEVVGYDQKGNPMIRKDKEDKPPTATQETTALYASRIKQANGVFEKLEGYLNNLPVVGTKMNELAPNFMKSSQFQSKAQAERNFLNAVLRRESGAVISPSEFSEGRQQYFPQPGDSPEVLSQKKANRDLVMKNFIKSSRSAYVPYEETDTGTAQNPEVVSGGGKQLDQNAAVQLLRQAGGDKNKARILAKQMGYSF